MSGKRKIPAVFLSFVLIAALFTALLILLHTNHRLESIQRQMLFTASDCCVEEIGEQEAELLTEEIPLEWYALQQLEYSQYRINSQEVYVWRGDEEYITLTCRLESGRMPTAENEVAAERWVLLNMGIEPECGREFTLYNVSEGRDERYKIAGILSDIPSDKKYGVKGLYAPLSSHADEEAGYNIYLRFPDDCDYEAGRGAVCRLLGISEKRVKKCPGREDFDEILDTDRYLTGILLVIAAVIFSGVYRIGLIAGQKEYGIYRAVGMTRRQLQIRLLLELYRDFLASIPIGAIVGTAAACLVSHMSGDLDQDIYLNNQSVSFRIVFPFAEMMAGFLLLALLVGVIGLVSGRAVVKRQIPVLLSGEDDVYHSIFYGLNQSAMQELEKYVVQGEIPDEGLKDDEIILSVLSMDDTKENDLPGHYQAGTPLMDYRAGDRIQMKYRKDFDTASLEYMQIKDGSAEYAVRSYRIAAIVSFPYMYDCNRTVFPLLIGSQDQLKKICPDYHIQRLYIDSTAGMTEEENRELERRLIRIGSRSGGVSTRSMTEDIRKNDQLFLRQMVYVSSMAAVAFILVLVNIENNLKYRMQVRTREINMCRSIGMSLGMLRCMLAWENGLLGAAGVLCGCLITGPVLQYLYRRSDRQAFAHPYHFHTAAFGMIAALVILLCLLLSAGLAGGWKGGRLRHSE